MPALLEAYDPSLSPQRMALNNHAQRSQRCPFSPGHVSIKHTPRSDYISSKVNLQRRSSIKYVQDALYVCMYICMLMST